MKPPSNNATFCKNCPYFTTSVCLMRSHVRRHRSSLTPFDCENSNAELYYCKYCKFQTDLAIFLKRHITSCHNIAKKQKKISDVEYSVRSYICKKCTFETYFLLKWIQHNVECSLNKEDTQLVPLKLLDKDVEPKQHKCSHCSFRAKSLKNIRIHVTRAHGPNRNAKTWYKCNDCRYECKWPRYLKRHQIARHLKENEIQWYHCKKCLFRAKFKGSLKRHLYTAHSNEQDIKWYECKKCPYKAKMKFYLQQHERRMHIVEKNINKDYKCDQCSYKATRNYILKQHIINKHLSSSEIQWYYCGRCSYKGKLKIYLKNHMRQHLNIWYECKQCTYKTKFKSHLPMHVSRMHSRRKK